MIKCVHYNIQILYINNWETLLLFLISLILELKNELYLNIINYRFIILFFLYVNSSMLFFIVCIYIIHINNKRNSF